MKQEVRNEDVEFFGGVKREQISLLEISPVRETENLRIRFCFHEAGVLKAPVLESIDTGYTSFPVEFGAYTAQESEATTYVEIFSSSSPRNGSGEKALMNIALVLSRILLEVVAVEWW